MSEEGQRLVLMFNGSPRTAGNTAGVLDRIQAELESYGDVKVERIDLASLDLKLCRGCFTCIAKGERHCPLKDAREDLEARMLKADGIVLASPLHVQNVSWLMKNFIDRFCYTNHRLRFFRQKVMLVAVGGMDLRTTIRAMRPALGGAQIVSELAYASMGWRQSPKAEAKKVKRLRREVGTFHAALADGSLPSPKVGDLMRFRFLKAVSRDLPEVLPADAAFFAERELYFYDVKVDPIRRGAAAMLTRLIMFISRDLGPYHEG